MTTTATVVAVVLGAHVLLKFTYFLLPYRRRRADLDRAYGGRLSATGTSDAVSLVVVVVAAVVVFVAGVHAPSFLIGLWCGATLIQLYFHEFHDPPPPDRASLGVVAELVYRHDLRRATGTTRWLASSSRGFSCPRADLPAGRHEAPRRPALT